MGNYCCSEEKQKSQNIRHKKCISGKIETMNSLLFETPKAAKSQKIKSQTERKCTTNDQTNQKVLSSQLIELCSGQPLITSGQSDIYEIDNIDTKLKQMNSRTRLVKKKNSLIVKKVRIEGDRCSNPQSPSQLLLMDNESPFLIKGIQWLNSGKFIFQIMEKQEGGDLSTFLEKTRGKGDDFRRLGDYGVQMILAGIILGLQYIHSNNIIYCDLKLENVLVGEDGYPLLIDFDLSYLGNVMSSDDFRGTLVYVAPQIFASNYADKGVDLWALGILTYILTYGEAPFEPQEITEAEFVTECKNKENRYYSKRKRASKQLISLINSLLKFKPSDRLGYKNYNDLKQHAFFSGFDWQKYMKKQLQSPLSSIVQKYSPKKPVSPFGLFSEKMDDAFLSPNKDYIEQRNTKCNISAKSSLQNDTWPSQ